jgi:hypothetical protein
MPETLILQILESKGDGMPLDDLLRALHAQGFYDDAGAKAGIWRLISQSSVQLTDDSTLRAVSQQQEAHP